VPRHLEDQGVASEENVAVLRGETTEEPEAVGAVDVDWLRLDRRVVSIAEFGAGTGRFMVEREFFPLPSDELGESLILEIIFNPLGLFWFGEIDKF
jgi:hypothetical protein